MKFFKTKEPLKEEQLPHLDEMTDILDIEEIISFPWDELLFMLGLIVLAIILIVGAYFLIRWWTKRRAHDNRDELLPPHKKVFLELERLDKQKFIERGDFRKYFYFLSEIYRRYLEERFGYPALEKTTTEILSDLTLQIGLPDDLEKIAENFLSNADLVKFGNYMPGAKGAIEEKDRIIAFVNETTSLIGANKEGTLQ